MWWMGKPASAISSLSMTSWCGRVLQIHVEQQGGAAMLIAG